MICGVLMHEFLKKERPELISRLSIAFISVAIICILPYFLFSTGSTYLLGFGSSLLAFSVWHMITKVTRVRQNRPIGRIPPDE